MLVLLIVSEYLPFYYKYVILTTFKQGTATDPSPDQIAVPIYWQINTRF